MRAPSLRFTLARFALLAPVMLVVSGCIAGPWTTENIYPGTAGMDIPVGVAVRAFGPTGDVVFVVERRDGQNHLLSTDHFLTMLRRSCVAGCAQPTVWPPVQVPPADQMPPAGLRNDQYYNASLALKGTVAPATTLDSAHIVRRTGPTAQCSNTELNLSEEEYSFASAAWSHNDIDANTIGNCQDRQLSYTLESGGMLYSCWTQDPDPTPMVDDDNQVWCSSRLTAGGVWDAPSLLADGVAIGGDQDHSWFDFDPVNALRYIVHRNRDANPEIITLRVPELGAAGDMPEGLMGVPVDRDYPSIARAADGSLHAVWHAPRNVGGHIRYARCPATRDCTQTVNWVPPVEIRTATGAQHAEIMIAENGRLMIMWIEEHDSGDRIHFKETCQGTAWPAGGGQVPRPAAGMPVDQSNFMGRPHITIDNTHSLVHLGFVEWDDKNSRTDGDVYWARKTFSGCP